jgi:hypothetical protein
MLGSTTAFADGGVVRGGVGGTNVFAGHLYGIHENGDEVFVPGRSGTIVPNGGGGRTINQTVHIDARGAQAGVAEQIAASMRAVLDETDRRFADRLPGAFGNLMATRPTTVRFD